MSISIVRGPLRTVLLRPSSLSTFFDPLQQLLREQLRLELGHQVQKPALLAQADGLGFIQARNPQQLEIRPVQAIYRGLQQSLAIAHIRSEAQINDFQNNSGCFTPPKRRGTLK